ncbi:MAG: hypothetical protein K9N06_07710 [Candidatus Cloacimonetes bacterium]|nr:hypothetical protein [Candidatus Cloacimonadota bacterium]
MTNSSISSSREAGLFFRRLAGFLLLSLAVVSLLSILCYHTVIKTIKDDRHCLLPENTEMLIMGDSHSMTGIMPDEHINTLNSAKRAEILPMTYLKLRFYTENNPQIKYIILSLGYHSLTWNREEVMYLPEAVSYYCDNYFQLYDKEMRQLASTGQGTYYLSWLKFVVGVPLELSKNISQYLRIHLGTFNYSYYPFWGGFTEMEAPVIDNNSEIPIHRHFFRYSNRVEMSNIMIDYFERIIKYCNERGIDIFVVNTPVVREYFEKVPEGYKSGMDRVLDKMSTKYCNLYYLDYSQMEMPGTCWLDSDHLSIEGAKKFSGILYKEIDRLNKE